jgi:tetratricopeptide (TPR) repeat protein
MANVSKPPCRWLVGLLAVSLCASTAFARTKSHQPADQRLIPLNTALAANDLDAAQLAATAIYQQATNAPALQSSDPSVIIDPAMVAETVEVNRTKAAVEIAQCFYNHAQLDLARQWAQTTTAGGTLANQFVRRATVLLGNIATAMDSNDEAVTNFLSVIDLPNLNHEQPAAYAGLLEALMLQKQDDLVAQWVQQGQMQFAGAGALELDFLKQASAALKRRNQPLWRELDEQVVGLSSGSAGDQLNALRQLASNARKFGRWAEAETNYAAICAMPLGSAEETVNSFLFLAESRANQGKDYAASVQDLESKIQSFASVEQQDYAHYRLAKFYHDQGRDELAEINYRIPISGGSTNTWAAASLHQLGALKEKDGDLQGALQLYLQYPPRFPHNDRLVMLAYASALNAADSLGDTNTSAQILNTITNRAAAIQDYNVHLNVAYHYKMSGNKELAQKFLASGLSLARQALQRAATPPDRYLIHFRVLRRMADFEQSQQTLDHFQTYAGDFSATDDTPDDYKYQCYWYKALALVGTGNKQAALDAFQWLADQEKGRPQLQARTDETIGFLNWQSANTNAVPILEAVARKFPTHPWANMGRLELAIARFNVGDFAAAQKLADEITNTLPENAKMRWVHKIYWGAVYLRGCCLQAQGDVSAANSLKQSALSKEPRLDIQNRVRAK